MLGRLHDNGYARICCQLQMVPLRPVAAITGRVTERGVYHVRTPLAGRTSSRCLQSRYDELEKLQAEATEIVRADQRRKSNKHYARDQV